VWLCWRTASEGGPYKRNPRAERFGLEEKRFDAEFTKNAEGAEKKGSGEKDRSPESLRGEAEYLVGGGGGDGNAHVFQAGACDAFFLGPRITLDDFTKFPDAGIFLAHFNEALALS